MDATNLAVELHNVVAELEVLGLPIVRVERRYPENQMTLLA